jgi:hypothetical protein
MLISHTIEAQDGLDDPVHFNGMKGVEMSKEAVA